jgi:hypothetical protein
MASGGNQEQRFSEELDRMLAGGEPPAAGDRQLDFARRMMDLRASPSDGFKDRLRQRLLDDVARRDTAEAQQVSWWARLKSALAHDMVARTAGVVSLVALAALVFGGMWQMGVFGSNGGTIVTQPPPTGPIVGSTGPATTTIEVNEPVTANGFTVHLSQIVLGPNGTEVYAATPPELSNGPTPPTAEAEYRFDGSAPADAGRSKTARIETGLVGHSWTITTPPAGAAELIFSITRVGDTPGPWTFVILLGR